MLPVPELPFIAQHGADVSRTWERQSPCSRSPDGVGIPRQQHCPRAGGPTLCLQLVGELEKTYRSGFGKEIKSKEIP